MKLIVATQNPKKLREIQELLTGFPLRVISLKEWGGKVEEVIEDGKSFWENAVKKAMAIAHQIPDCVLADDSGLEVDALDGAPGVFSARFAAIGTGLKPAPTDEENNQKLLQLLKDVPLEKRTARFRCSVAIAHEKRLLGVVEGKCEGTIAFTLVGNYGFGYDPLFIPKGYQQTFGELGEELKHKISHRAEALAKAKELLVHGLGTMP
jgi:XTP/dITP diphosphohydrolase